MLKKKNNLKEALKLKPSELIKHYSIAVDNTTTNLKFSYLEDVKSNYYLWREYRLKVNSIVSENVLFYFIGSFYDNIIMANKTELKSYYIIFKIVGPDDSVRSISKVLTFNKDISKKKIISLLSAYWAIKSEYYHLMEIKELLIGYRLVVAETNLDKSKVNTSKGLGLSLNKLNLREFKFNGLNLPRTTLLNEWGKVKNQENQNSIHIESNIKIGTQKIYYNVFKSINHNIIQIFSNKTLISTVFDWFINGNVEPKTFHRYIDNNKFTYINGIMQYKEINRKVQYIKQVSKTLYRTTDYITLDIETINVRGALKPVCISLFDGKKKKSFFITDYSSELNMVKATFMFLSIRKYNYQKIFVHNLSNFDGVFLLKNLSSFTKIKPIMRESKIYNLRIEILNNKNQKIVLYIRDSYLLLPSSLKNLSKSFQIKNMKSIFPIHCLNYLPLNYVGNLPPKRDFLTEEDYVTYFSEHKKPWNLKLELIKYCENDVIALHQAINKFANEMFKLFRLDIVKCFSLSSVALDVFRSNFMAEQNIPKILGKMYNDISMSYKGGLVDMFIPEGKNLFFYDVNSEYLEAMCLDMPAGNVKYFEGDLDLNDINNFGFFKAEVVSNDNLNIPVLPVKYKNTILCPTGKWTDWYFSEELKEAQNVYGYKIKVLKGYKFERKILFSDYVKTLYSYKVNSNKDDPKYFIFKLLLNSLYGKFGMKPVKEETIILSNYDAENYLNNPNITITDVIDLGSGKELLKLFSNNEERNSFEFDSPNISVAIASAIVSYARIKINKLKHLPGIKVYYSDTDSIITNKAIPSKYIGKELGQLKLEDKIKLGYFLAPKLFGYSNLTYDNIVKNKGFKNKIFFYELSFLLYKDTLIKKDQVKWYKDWSNGVILTHNEVFTLTATAYKRQLIYDSSSKIVSTKPYIFIDGFVINSEPGYILNIISPDFKEKLLTSN